MANGPYKPKPEKIRLPGHPLPSSWTVHFGPDSIAMSQPYVAVNLDFWSLLNIMNLTKLIFILFELNSFMFYSEKKV